MLNAVQADMHSVMSFRGFSTRVSARHRLFSGPGADKVAVYGHWAPGGWNLAAKGGVPQASAPALLAAKKVLLWAGVVAFPCHSSRRPSKAEQPQRGSRNRRLEPRLLRKTARPIALARPHRDARPDHIVPEPRRVWPRARGSALRLPPPTCFPALTKAHSNA
jgi:hypothetical protein